LLSHTHSTQLALVYMDLLRETVIPNRQIRGEELK